MIVRFVVGELVNRLGWKLVLVGGRISPFGGNRWRR